MGGRLDGIRTGEEVPEGDGDCPAFSEFVFDKNLDLSKARVRNNLWVNLGVSSAPFSSQSDLQHLAPPTQISQCAFISSLLPF